MSIINSLEALASGSNKITRKSRAKQDIVIEVDRDHGYSKKYLKQYAGYSDFDVELYCLTYSYISQFARETQLGLYMQKFIDVFDNEQAEHPYDSRDPELVYYGLGSTMCTLFITLAIDCNNIKQVAGLLNNHVEIRALINALIPYSLPPHQRYSASSLYRIITICAEAAETRPDSELSEHYNLWNSLRLKSSITPSKRNEYHASHGFLNGTAIISDKPFKDTLGGDGQELRASYMEEEAGPGKHYVSVSIYNCTDRSLVDLVIKQKKNHERAGFKEILSSFQQLSGFVFMADALNTEEDLFNFTHAKGIDLLMPVKANNGNKKVKQLTHQMFSGNDLDCCESFKKFDSGAYISGNRIERVTVETLSVSELEHLKESQPDQYLGLDPHAMDGYDAVKTVVKKTKFTKVVGKRYSQKALEKFNSENEEGEVRYYISTIENDEHGFKQILVSLNEYWLCEQAHNTADTVLEQDYIASGSKSNLALRVNFSRSAVDMLNMYKAEHNAAVKKSHQYSYATARLVLSRNLSERLKCLNQYFSSIFINCDPGQ